MGRWRYLAVILAAGVLSGVVIGPAGRSEASTPPVAAAGPRPAPPGPGRPAPVAPPPAVAPATPGCRGGDPRRLTGTLVSRGTSRRYAWHLPARVEPRRPLPVVLVFHGRGHTPQDTRVTTGLDGADALVLYPEGRPARTAPGGALAWEGTRDLPLDGADVGFVTDLLGEAARHVCTDPRRVYATGASQGGGFTHVLACSAPGLLAGIAPVAGAFYRPTTGGCIR